MKMSPGDQRGKDFRGVEGTEGGLADVRIRLKQVEGEIVES